MDCAFLGKWLINEHDVETVCLLSKLREAKHHASVKPDDLVTLYILNIQNT